MTRRLATAGLTDAEVAQRSPKQEQRYPRERPRTVGQIVRANVFTRGSTRFWRFAAHLATPVDQRDVRPVIVANSVIGMVQEHPKPSRRWTNSRSSDSAETVAQQAIRNARSTNEVVLTTRTWGL